MSLSPEQQCKSESDAGKAHAATVGAMREALVEMRQRLADWRLTMDESVWAILNQCVDAGLAGTVTTDHAARDEAMREALKAAHHELTMQHGQFVTDQPYSEIEKSTHWQLNNRAVLEQIEAVLDGKEGT